jgi:hypothetical protein
LAICLAISKGEVSQAIPSRVEPSGMVMVMGTRGWAICKEKGNYQQNNHVSRPVRKTIAKRNKNILLPVVEVALFLPASASSAFFLSSSNMAIR